MELLENVIDVVWDFIGGISPPDIGRETCLAALLTCSWWKIVSLFLNVTVGESRPYAEQLLA